MTARKNLVLLTASLALALVAVSVSGQQIGLTTRSLTFPLWGNGVSVGVSVPQGWSVDPQSQQDSYRLVEPGAPATILIRIEPRLDHADALQQIREATQQVSAEHKEILEVGGWPALRVTRVVPSPRPDQAPEPEHTEELQILTYVAFGDKLVVVSGTLPPDADAQLTASAVAISSSLTFASQADPTELEQDRKSLQGSADSGPDVGSQSLSLAGEPTLSFGEPAVQLGRSEVGPGANARINTSGFGELEIATDPSGQHVVVALQGRRWVSSNDGGSNFPNSGIVGSGNGDPSVAWGQSGRFYQAWIDTNCGTNYLNPVVAPGPAPNGLDCTGIARSDDDGVSFQTNTVNPAVVCIGQAPAGMPANPGECFPDQEHIAADRWNPGDTAGDDQVYSTWRNFPNPNQTSLVCSSDSGVTWTPPVVVGTNEAFPRVTVGRDGFVYLATYNRDSNMFRLWKFTSCVNGLTPVGAPFPVNVAARDEFQCPFAGHDRCDQNPTSQTAIVDSTDPNHVYYAYVDDSGNSDSGDSDIIVRDSLDGGASWPGGRVVQANIAVSGRRIFPWLCTTGGDAIVTWYEQTGALPTDSTDYVGAQIGLDAANNLVSKEAFTLSQVPDNWCDIGWQCLTRWGNTDTQTSNASEACPSQPQLAGQCGDGDSPNVTPDSGNLCDFDDDDGVTFTNCLNAGASPSGNDEKCLRGSGCPKYGDYNGNACTGGKLFAAWASANAPSGLASPDTSTNPGVLFDVINLDIDAPVITIPGSVNFGLTCSSAALVTTLDVCNTGGANLQVDTISSDNPDFAVTVPSSGFPVTISPDFCFPFEVTFTPSGIGTSAGVLTVPSNDSDRPTVEVDVSGVVGAPDLNVAMANSGGFGEVCTGDQQDLDLILLNQGLCDLTIDAISSDDPTQFQLPTSTQYPLILSSDASFTVPVRFSPTVCGSQESAEITISSDSPGENLLVIPAEGTVPCPDINLAIANSGDFGAVCKNDHADLDLTLFNQGRCDLTISALELLPDPNSFELPVNLQLPLILSPDADFALPLRFAPGACFFGKEQRTLKITSDDPDEMMVNVGLKGKSPCPDIIIDPGSLSELHTFPPTVVDTTGTLGCFSERTAVLRNVGLCPATISEITAAAGDFTVTAPTQLPILLPPGEETLGVTVRFTPQSDANPLAPSEVTGLLTVVSDDPNSPDLADLCGESSAQSGVRILVTEVSTGTPIPVDGVDALTISSQGITPRTNLRFTNHPVSMGAVCGNPVLWHVDQETLQAAGTTGNNPQGSYTAKAKEGNVQITETFGLDQCELREFQLQLGGGTTCLLLPKGASCTNAGECCSGKCKGPEGGKTCK